MEYPALGADRLEAILGVVRDISSPNDVASFRDTVLAGVEELIDADVRYMVDAEVGASSIEVVQAPSDRAVPDEVALAALDHHHPLVHEFMTTGDGSARRLSDVISTADYHALPIYANHYGDHGIEYQLGATIPCPETRVLAIGLNRRDADFTDEEVAVLDRLRPHLVQSVNNVEIRTRLTTLLEETAGGDLHSVALVDDGKIVEAGSRVVESLRSTFGGEARATSLPRDVEDWSRSEAVRLDSVDDRAGARLHEPLVARHDQGRVVLRYLRGDDVDVVVVDERRKDRAARLLGYGLTNREAEVLAQLASGSTNQQIGRVLGISPHTVRKHLERVFKKLGVDSRTAAVALAYEAFLSPDGH